MSDAEDVLRFWLDETGPEGWYKGGAELDEACRTRFEDLWKRAAAGSLSLWLTYPSGTLAYIILTDQLPRNMFRGTAKAFKTDAAALAAAKMAIARGWDLRIDEPARMFFYMPLEHAESLCDQDRAVRLMLTRMPGSDAEYLLHAKAHRDVIRRFGRFPARNEALGRAATASEEAWLSEGGYGRTLEALKTVAA